MTTKEFLQFFPDFCIQTFDDRKDNKDISLTSCGKPSKYSKDQIKQLNEKGAGIYFTPNRFPTGIRRATECTGVNAWIVENDDLSIDEQWVKIKASPLQPSFVVQSKNSLHCYWLAKQGTIENYTQIVKGLIKHFGGDEACKDISRVFRVPGFYHQKDRSKPFMVGIVEEHPELLYDDLDMMFAFPYSEAPKSLIQREINTDDFWTMLGSLDNKSVLVRLSGQPIVNSEMIEFKKRRPEGEYIYVNGEMCDAWLDEQGMIGSGKRGGPTWIQWLGFYGIPKSEIARWAKDNLIEVKKWCEEHEQKVVEKQVEEIAKPVVKKDYKLRYTWGTPELDDTFGIIKRGNFLVLAAKRSSGKTTYVFDMACKNAQKGHRVLFLSLEMDTEAIKDDIARKYAGITIPEERDYRIPETKQLAFQRKKDEINNNQNLLLVGMRSTESILWGTILETIKKQGDIDLLIIDNLDLIGSEGRENDLERQKRIVKNILAYTQTSQVPLILIHHYRKSPSDGKDKGMDEMAGSGKIADGADMVLKVARTVNPDAEYPERYKTTLFMQKCRGYREAVKEIYFIAGSFVDIPPIKNDLIPL